MSSTSTHKVGGELTVINSSSHKPAKIRGEWKVKSPGDTERESVHAFEGIL